jgi:hypothetical protein
MTQRGQERLSSFRVARQFGVQWLLSAETVRLRNILWRRVRIVGRKPHGAVSVPTDRIVETIITPKKLVSYDERRRTENAQLFGDIRFRH